MCSLTTHDVQKGETGHCSVNKMEVMCCQNTYGEQTNETKPNPQPVFASHFYSIVCLAQTPQGATLPSITAEHGGIKVDNLLLLSSFSRKKICMYVARFEKLG
jgi:hypothetical protein